MTLQRTIIESCNKVLRLANLKLDTLTAAKNAAQKLSAADQRGAFTKATYPVPDCFLESSHQSILDAMPHYAENFASFKDPVLNKVGYEYENDFYSCPDAEVLYTIVRTLQPKTIFELGCGNSTRITRLAIRDGNLDTKLICLDPYPRRDVEEFADAVHLKPVEDSNALELVKSLQSGDVFFIDTSHDVRPANDCAYIYGVLIPAVPAGVVVHIHDIFLPYDYPARLAFGDGASWGEQTVVAAMLQAKNAWDAIWPGYYLQHTLPNFASYFPASGCTNVKFFALNIS
jgi:predicted O-methyltransferase YrrM